ncbi:hypothetical protein WAI453_001895 [Rhynchosporium graminicola]
MHCSESETDVHKWRWKKGEIYVLLRMLSLRLLGSRSNDSIVRRNEDSWQLSVHQNEHYKNEQGKAHLLKTMDQLLMQMSGDRQQPGGTKQDTYGLLYAVHIS